MCLEAQRSHSIQNNNTHQEAGTATCTKHPTKGTFREAQHWQLSFALHSHTQQALNSVVSQSRTFSSRSLTRQAQ